MAFPTMISEIPYNKPRGLNASHIRVDISRIPGLNSCIPGSLEHREGFLLVQNPLPPGIGAVRHAAKD